MTNTQLPRRAQTLASVVYSRIPQGIPTRAQLFLSARTADSLTEKGKVLRIPCGKTDDFLKKIDSILNIVEKQSIDERRSFMSSSEQSLTSWE